MSLFKLKKQELPEDVKNIENFNNDLKNLIESNNYVSRKNYEFLFPKYEKSHNSLAAIKNAELLKSYCKKNRLSENLILDFLSNYKNLKSIIDNRNKSFVEFKLKSEKEYLDNILKSIDPNIKLDDDQRKVVITDEDYCLVIAGAGAGKTTTVAAKVKYLVEKKNIDPKQILIISFTNKAVGELRDKINKSLNIQCPITTFHSAGNAILRKKTDEKLNIVEGGFLYNTVKDYFLNKIKDKRSADNIMLFFGSYFDNQYDGDNKQEYLNNIAKSDFSTLKSNLNEYKYTYTERNSNKKVTLNNEIVNSAQEVQIANFLYLNNIEYEYEPSYPYYIFMAKKRYTPDFLIKQNGKIYYLEHFGISENGENNKYTKEELEKYKKCINDKILIHKKHNTNLIYTFSQYNDGKSLLDHLKQLLCENGIVLNPKSSNEVLNKLTSIQENKYVSKIVYLICDFINNFKVNGYTEEQFYEFLRTTKSERTRLFLEICRECYLEYQKALVQNNAVDFQDMINDAARALKEVASLKEKLDFKYIIIDEYQDISRQRFDMAKELSKVTNAKIIAVGDDWQSIFAFSGSDVTLFTQFCEKMGYGEELKITRTYRNAQEVIDIAGGFIQKNDTQIKKSLISPKYIDNPVILISYDDSPIQKEESVRDGGPLHRMAIALEKAIGEIVSNFGSESKILLIGRYGYDGSQLERTKLFKYYENGNKVVSEKYPNVKIDFLTAHSSKGLGYDNVIIINAKNAVYGFPSKIEDDPVMKLVIKQHNEIEYAEERRLFYVALTRTKNRVYLIVPEKHPSQFVLEIKNEYKNVVLKGNLNPEQGSLITNKICPLCGYPLQRRYNKSCGMTLWICTNEPEVCGFLSNNLIGGKMSIQKCTECLDGYLIVKTKNEFPFLGCTNYKVDGSGCNNTLSQKEYSDNINKNEIIDFDISKQFDNEHNTYFKNNSSCDKQLETKSDHYDIKKESNDICEAVHDINENEEKNYNYFSDDKLNELAIALRKFAENMSKRDNIPFWKILRKKAIIDICKKRPTSIQDFYDKKVLLGKEKVKKYGFEILNILNNHNPQPNQQNINNKVNYEISICDTIIQACKNINNPRYYGITMLANFLKGNKPQSLIDAGLNNKELYGCLNNITTQSIIDLIEYLIDENILYQTKGLYPTVRVNQNITDINIDCNIVHEILNHDFYNNQNSEISNIKTQKYGNYEVIVDDNGVVLTDINLLETLRQIRFDYSLKNDMPAFYICSNRILVMLATLKPKTKEEFLSIKGIKDKWYETYAQLFIEAIKEADK